MNGLYIVFCVVAGNLVYDSIMDFATAATLKILKKKEKREEKNL